MQNLLPEEHDSKSFLKDAINDIEWLDFVAFACSTWLFIYPYPYKLLFCILLFIPFLGLVLNRMAGNSGFDSLIKKIKDKNGNDAHMVAYYINIVSWTVGIKVFVDFEFENFLQHIYSWWCSFYNDSLRSFHNTSQNYRTSQNATINVWITSPKHFVV